MRYGDRGRPPTGRPPDGPAALGRRRPGTAPRAPARPQRPRGADHASGAAARRGDCYVDLPPALGGLRLTGRVAWTRLRSAKKTLEGERRSHYESGIEFTGLTPRAADRAGAALELLRAARVGVSASGH